MVYFIYPKKKDAQKMILVLFGFLTGSFLKRGTYLLTRDDLSNMLIICFVVEFLIYQARYQWNDIRGVEEDQSEQKSNRLPVKILGKYVAIFFSSVLIVIRVIGALVIVLHLKDEMKYILLIGLIMIFVSTLLYEISRSFKKVFLTFLTVSFGYAIRFGIGMWCANPEIWYSGLTIYDRNITRIIIIGLLFSYALLGEFSVALSWIQEAVFQKECGIELRRVHYIYLYESFRKHRIGKYFIGREFLKENGKILDLWNATYIASIVLLAGISCYLRPQIFIIELPIIISSVLICIGKRMKLYIGILVAFGLTGIFYSIYNYQLYFLNGYMCVTQCMFTGIYVFLRFF